MANRYITPTGSGDKSGSSWENAATLSSLDLMVQKAGAGGSVLLKADAGAYDVSTKSINLSHGGTDGRPVTIRGVDALGHDMDAMFVGSRATDSTAFSKTGGQAFVLDAGAKNLVFSHLDIKNVSNAFRAASDIENIEIGNVTATNVQRFFEDRQANDTAGKTATVSGLYIHDVDVMGYSKGFIRLQFDSHDVLIKNVVADSAGQTFDNFAMGAHIDGTAHNVTFDTVTLKNNQNFLGPYLNGDGFATEGGTYRITFIDTVSSGNTDAGYDLKSDQTTLIRAVADDNSRNFRIWGNDNVMIDSTGVDPHNRAGSYGTQIWMNGGADLKVTGSQFVDSGSMTRVFNFDGKAALTLDDTEVTYGGTLTFGSSSGLNGLSANDVTKVNSNSPFSTDTQVVLKDMPAVAKPHLPSSAPQLDLPIAPLSSHFAEGAHIAELGTTKSLNGTSAADYYLFNNSGDLISGTKSITSFSSEDRLVTSAKLYDENGDGRVTFDSSDRLSLSSTGFDLANTIKISATSGKALSAINLVDEFMWQEKSYYVYGSGTPATSIKPTNGASTSQPLPHLDSPHKPGGAIEGTTGNDVLEGTQKSDVFFFDTAANVVLGKDTIRQFTGGDRIVTTTALADSNHDDRITFNSSDTIELINGDGTQIGTLKVFGSSGKALSGLTLIDEAHQGMNHYFVYTAVNDHSHFQDLMI